jgi:hypothetical protein
MFASRSICAGPLQTTFLIPGFYESARIVRGAGGIVKREDVVYPQITPITQIQI